MSIWSMLAIYFLFWFGSLFFILPLGVKTNADYGRETEIGHAESAPVNFSPKKIILRTTALSLIVFVLFLLNDHYGWLNRENLDLTSYLR